MPPTYARRLAAARLHEALIAPGFAPNVQVMKNALVLVSVLALGGCAGQMPTFLQGPLGLRGSPPPHVDAAPAPRAPSSSIEQTAIDPPSGADTAAELDSSTPDDRVAALAPAVNQTSGEQLLGTTVASLGDPAETGFWIKTALVSAPADGRVVYAASGRSVRVQLIPSGGAPGGGSEVSLAAMRLLDAPLTDLPELVVYRN